MQQKDNIQLFYVRPMHKVDGKYEAMKGTHPIACVALKRDENGNVARGISIVANKATGSDANDNWCKAEGRNRAIARCRRAMGCQCSSEPMGMPVYVKCGDGVTREQPMDASIRFLEVWRTRFPGEADPEFKSACNPALTKFEIELLDIADARKQGQLTQGCTSGKPMVPPLLEMHDIPCCQVPCGGCCSGETEPANARGPHPGVPGDEAAPAPQA